MQKQIFTLAVLLLSFQQIIAQSDIENKYFKSAVADTIKNESVVIVRDFEEYTIKSKAPYDYKTTVVLRSQYKIKDLSALNLFSTLYKSEGLKKINITQIKPNGKTKTIYDYTDNNYEENRSESNINLNEGDDQIAVENLEIGDIIDYRYEYTYTTNVYEYTYKNIENAYAPREALIKNYNLYRKLPFKIKFLQEKYPSLSAQLVFILPKELDLIQNARNCNYQFEEKNIDGFNATVCNIGYVKAYKAEDFSFPYADLPVLKYAIVQSNNAAKGNLYQYQFTDAKVTPQDVANLGRAFYNDKRFMPKYLYYTKVSDNKNGYKMVSLNTFFKSFIKTFAKDNTDKIDVLNKFHEFIINNDEINTWQFSTMNMAVLLAKFCDKIKQPYKMMACYGKDDGEWQNVIHPKELNWGIYIDNGGEDLFICSNNAQGNIYQKYAVFSGTDAIVFNTKELTEPEAIKYPEIKYTNNKGLYESDIKLIDPKLYTYHFNNTYNYTGAQKQSLNDYIEGKFSPEELSTNAPFYGLVNYRKLYHSDIFKDTATFYPEDRRLYASFNAQRNENKNNDILYFLYDEYNFNQIELDSFRLFNNGEYEDNETSECGFKAEFKVKDLIQETANGQLLMSFGKLISEQYEISKFKSNERFTNVNIKNQREFNWKITIELPKDYKPMNLQDFNQNFENIAGIFKAEVTQKGNTLTLNATKIYKTNYLPKEQWKELQLFLNQAVLFYEKKMLLEKN